MAQASFVHDQHDDIRVGPADLETEAAAFHPNGSGCTPTCMILTANRISAAPFRADAKRRLLHPRHDDDAQRTFDSLSWCKNPAPAKSWERPYGSPQSEG